MYRLITSWRTNKLLILYGFANSWQFSCELNTFCCINVINSAQAPSLISFFILTAVQTPTWMQTRQMLYLEAFCRERQNRAGYKARLLLWQWKQWLNIGTDWNNHAVCPLVPHTSCLTKLNPCWCRAFRPVSPSRSFCLSFSKKKKKSAPFVCQVFCPHPRIGVTGFWREATFCSFRRQSVLDMWQSTKNKIKMKRHWKGGQEAELGAGWNEHEIEG